MIDFSTRKMAWARVLILVIVSALLSALSFPPCSIEILAWISLVPLIYSLPYQTLRQTFASHALYMICFFGTSLSWTGRVHPICPIVILIPLYFICMPFPFVFRWLVRKGKIPVFFAAPVVWCAGDYLRSFIFTGFPWLFPGHTQAFYPALIQIADITGVYGVTFAIVLVNALLASWLHCCLDDRDKGQLKRLVAYSAGTILLLGTILGYGWYCLRTTKYEYGPEIIAIQGNIPQDIKDDPNQNFQRVGEVYDRLTFEAIERYPNADLLVWPETMAMSDPMTDSSSLEKFQDIALRNRMHLLIGAHHLKVAPDDSDVVKFNSAYFMNSRGKFVGRYDKIRLVMLGEYLPLQNTFTFLPPIVRDVAGFLPDLSAGDSRPIFSLGQNRFGVLICYDIVYSEDARALRKKGSRFLINMTNEGWFSHTCELEQMLEISIFRAVENRVGILRAGNTGITGTIPPTGRIVPEQLFTLPYRDYATRLREYTPFVEEEVAGKKAFAWHHLPGSIWHKEVPMFAELDRDWDVVFAGKRVKWKDFPGIFCIRVPMSTPDEPIYTKVGNLFAQIISAFALAMIVRVFFAGSKLRFSLKIREKKI